MSRSITYVQARELRVGDVLVNAGGSDFTVTAVARVGRGYRVRYLRADGGIAAFTAAPEAITRVTLPRAHERMAATG
ncbi:hypothetical protein [Agromyces ramosus]|uniref:DUF1918 domain-containing protein n=1 Tax=Agromyces ramosus TaxID=33879 RepID=A0ABU0R3P0_9MICO|nr:hypothetical protein [Agromyces ramosus]MDQ0892699.1 hypothetical protein [Agromyces ramosus]